MTEVIQVAREMRVLLQFTTFEMETSENYYDYYDENYYEDYGSGNGYNRAATIQCNDHLTITDGDGTTLLPQSCGSTIPSVIKSTSNLVKLSFKTNGRISGMGWSANWTAITPG